MTDETFPYDPDYVIAPGCSFQEFLEDSGFDIVEIAKNSDYPEGYVLSILNDVLDCKPLNERHVKQLADITGIPEYIWFNMEQNYRVGLEAGKHDISNDILRRN